MNDDVKCENALKFILYAMCGLIICNGLLYAMQDLQMDFFGYYDCFRMFLNGKSPYFNTADSYMRLFPDAGPNMLRYPPFFFIFSWLGLTGFAYAKLIWTVILLVSVGIQFKLIYKYYGIESTLFMAVLMLSFPVTFAIQRGSNDLLVAMCVTIFTVLYLRGEKPMIAILALSTAISLKIAPAIIALVFLHKRDYRGFVKLIIATLAINIVAALLASLIYPEVIPDFFKVLSAGEYLEHTQKYLGIDHLINNNWLSLEGHQWRFSMNYFGSYMGLSLGRFIYYITTHLNLQVHYYILSIIIIISVGLLLWVASIKTATEVFLARLILSYCVLNPRMWGPGLPIMFISLVIAFNDHRRFLMCNERLAALIKRPAVIVFWLSTLFVLSPRIVPWEYHQYYEAMMSGAICMMIVLIKHVIINSDVKTSQIKIKQS